MTAGQWSKDHPARKRRSPVPVEGIEHGASGYAKGCGCEVCTKGNSEYRKALKAAKPKERTRAEGDERRTVFRRSRYTPDQTAAIRQYAEQDGVNVAEWLRKPVLAILWQRRKYRDTAPRYAPTIARAGATADDRPGTSWTETEWALIGQLAAEDGQPVDQWLRAPVIAELEDRGYRQTERTKVPRSRSRRTQEVSD